MLQTARVHEILHSKPLAGRCKTDEWCSSERQTDVLRSSHGVSYRDVECSHFSQNWLHGSHLLGSGRLDIDDHTVIHSGEEQEHRRGVAFVLDKKLSRSLVSWQAISSRILTARLLHKHGHLTVVSHMHQLKILPRTAKMSSTSLLNQLSPPDLLMTKLWSSVTSMRQLELTAQGLRVSLGISAPGVGMIILNCPDDVPAHRHRHIEWRPSLAMSQGRHRVYAAFNCK